MDSCSGFHTQKARVGFNTLIMHTEATGFAMETTINDRKDAEAATKDMLCVDGQHRRTVSIGHQQL
jgi:hypothetical protein